MESYVLKYFSLKFESVLPLGYKIDLCLSQDLMAME